MISIQDVIYSHVREENAKRERSGEVSLSQIGKCNRQLMLQVRKAKAEPYTDRQLCVFAVGYIFEKFVLDILEQKGLLLKRQEPVEYRGIKGTCDAILLDKESGENILFDVKSVHSAKFQYLDAKPDLHYAFQLSGYHLGLAPLIKLYGTSRLVYISKDDLLVKEVGVNANDNKVALDKKIDDIKKWLASPELPPEEPQESWECFTCSERYREVKIWCKYIKHCPKIYAEYEKKVAEMSVPKEKKTRKKK